MKYKVTTITIEHGMTDEETEQMIKEMFEKMRIGFYENVIAYSYKTNSHDHRV